MKFIIITSLIGLALIAYLMLPTIKHRLGLFWNKLSLKTKTVLQKLLIYTSTIVYYIIFWFCVRDILPEYNKYINIFIAMVMATLLAVIVVCTVFIVLFKDHYKDIHEDNVNDDEHVRALYDGYKDYVRGNN